MSSHDADIEVIYWPVPFRGNAIKLLLEDANVKYQSIEENIEEMRNKKGLLK